MKPRLAILISGGGTTMAEIIKAAKSGLLDLDIACVISNNPEADGLNKAKDLGIPSKDILIISPKPREDFGQRLLKELTSRGTALIGQHGWLPLTPEIIIQNYPDKIFNQHPGNPHLFGGKGMWGLTVHQSALNFYQQTNKEENAWMIVQKVAPEFDGGKVLAATPVKIQKDDTAFTLQSRSLPIEHQNVINFYQNLLNQNLQPINLTKLSNLNESDQKILQQCHQTAIDMKLNG